MNLSLKWLKDFVNIDVAPKKYADEMTMSGSKVEGFKCAGDEIKNVVVGKIISIEKHPDAEKLQICMLDVGEEVPIQIVTGAKNVTVGDFVPVAKDGSNLPNGKEINAGKLRGVMSYGMLCSLSELNLTKNDYPYAIEDGIFIMQEDCKVGQEIKEVLGLDDVVVEFEITSNRPDCLSVIGLARETAATFDVPFSVNIPKVTESDGKIEDYISVKVSEPMLCPRYCARVVKNVKIEPSPNWMRERLRSSGVRPINNIVDITNYVMLEYGQPMHAFDYECISGKQINVRVAANGEKMNTLDGNERELDSSCLVIADETKAVALAGIMGGENSEIKDSTKTVVFESANFFGAGVRLTAKKVGLRTESSGRFEKGLDPNNALLALERACELIVELKAGEVVKGLIDVDNSSKETTTFPLEADWINRFLGVDIAKEQMIKYLNSLEIKVENDNVFIPSFRADLEHKADIAEEIARIYGYNNIPSAMFKGSVNQGKLTKKQAVVKKLNDILLSAGLTEICTYSFISPKYYDKILLEKDSTLRKSVTISNPLGEETSIMRTTPLPSMLEVLARNYNLRNKVASLFEIATVYLPNVDEKILPTEKQMITIGLYDEKADYFTLKGIVELILDSLKVKNYEFVSCTTDKAFHTGRTAKLFIGNEEAGILGEISPLVLNNYDMDVRAYAAMIDLELLISLLGEESQYKQLPKFPSTARDLALICPDELPVSAIEKVIKNTAHEILESVELFDVYKGKQISEGLKSVAYSVVFRAEDKTLADTEIDVLMNKLFIALEEIGAKLRT